MCCFKLFKYDRCSPNLPKKNCVHDITDSVFDRYPLSRLEDFHKKAQNLSNDLAYSH